MNNKEFIKILEKEHKKIENTPARVYVWDFIKKVKIKFKRGG